MKSRNEIRLSDNTTIKVDYIQDYIDGKSGRVYSAAIIEEPKRLFYVVSRDADGPIWEESK
jgi:hypothetical protein